MPGVERGRAFGATAWTSTEGQKHDIMRGGWDRWVYLGEDPILMPGGRILKRLLAAMAVHALPDPQYGKGSMNTYMRYVDEDVAGGFLEEFRDMGRVFVRRTDKKFDEIGTGQS